MVSVVSGWIRVVSAGFGWVRMVSGGFVFYQLPSIITSKLGRSYS